jgi:tellurite resistance protein
MVRKSLVVGGVIVLLLGLFFGRDAISYSKTALSGVRHAVKDAVPVEFELTRARDMIKGLTPEIRHNMHVIATEEVEVQGLRDQLAAGEKQIAKNKADIERLTTDLKNGGSQFVYCGKSYTSKQVESDLTNRFEQFKVKEATVGKLRQILAAREAGLVAGREKLKVMEAAKTQLELDIANHDARLEMVKVAQSSSNFNFDDSRLSRTKELVKEIGTRIDVAEKLVNAETVTPGQINLEEPVSTNITEQITNYFKNAGEKEAEQNVVKLD